MSGLEQFKKLGNISKKDHIVNVFAVVKFFKKPSQTKGSHLSVFLKLVDPTLHENEACLKCVFFEEKVENFPIINIGDVVKFTSLGISVYQTELQGRNRNNFSWVTFDGRPDMPITPRFSPKSPATFNEADKKIVQELKTWAASFDFLSPKTLQHSLDKITGDNLYFDLVCQVVAVGDRDVTKGSMVLHAWDGTFPAVSGIASKNLDSFSSVTKWGRKILGKCVEIYVFRKHSDPASSVNPGDYVRITNLHLTSKEGADGEIVPFLSLHEGNQFGRGITVLSQDNPAVKELIQRMEALSTPFDVTTKTPSPGQQLANMQNHSRSSTGVPANERPGQFSKLLASGNPRRRLFLNEKLRASSKLPTPGNSAGATPRRAMCRNLPLSSIKIVRETKHVPHLFRCRAKVFAYMPKEALDFVKYACRPCNKLFSLNEIAEVFDSGITRTCKTTNCGQPLSLALFFSLILRDDTGLLDVIVFNDDAKVFFPDIDPAALVTDGDVQQLLDQRMRCLLSGNIWVEYVIKSYYNGAAEGGGRVAVYRISETRFPIELEKSLRDATSLTNM